MATATSMAISLDGSIAFHPRHTPHRRGHILDNTLKLIKIVKIFEIFAGFGV
jgi:hypothetical protein